MRHRLFSLLLAHRLGVCVALAALSVFFGIFAARVGFDNTIESYFLASDIEDYNRFLEVFGSDEIVVVAFGGENVFTPQNFAVIDTLSRGLERLPHVRRVISLTTTRAVTGTAEAVDFDRLTPDRPLTTADLSDIRRRALADPVIPGTLVAADGRSTAVVAEIDHLIGQFDYKVALLQRVRALMTDVAARTGKRLHLAGTSVVDDAMFRHTATDQRLFFPMVVVAIVVLMYAMFRRVMATLLPLLIVVLSVVWAYGFMDLLGYKINVITMITAPLLMAVGIADSIHVVSDYLQRSAERGHGGPATAAETFDAVLAPCFLTSATTVVGLGSLLIADLTPVRQFGLVAAFGVAAAFLITILLVPILLTVLPVAAAAPPRARRGRPLDAVIEHLAVWRRGRSLAVLAISAIVAIPAAVSAAHITIGTNSMDFFRRDDPVRLDTAWIDTRIGGTMSMEFLIDATSHDGLRDPALLRRMERFQRYLEGLDGITGAYSIADAVKTLNQAFHDGAAPAFRIPDSAAAIAQELLVVEGSDDFRSLVSDDYMQGRISARVAMDRSRELAHQMPAIEATLRRTFGDTAQVTPTGLVFLMHRMERYLLSSQLKSFAIAFVVIALSMVLTLRSLRLGLLAMIPNVLPILFVMGLMPLMGINLDVGTVMIAGVALGLIVDDSIHLLYRFGLESTDAPDTRSAMARSIRKIGRPLIITSIVLCLGLSVLTFASFQPVIHFGKLTAIVIALALVFDLVVLPAMVGFLRIRRQGNRPLQD